jgi:hypothetical protein
LIIAAFQEKDGPETGWIMPEPMIQRANQVFLFLFHWVQYPAPPDRLCPLFWLSDPPLLVAGSLFYYTIVKNNIK